MATPMRNDNTLRMRELSRGLRSGKIRVSVTERETPVDFDGDEENPTRVGAPPLSIPARTAGAWNGLPRWVQIVVALASIAPIIATAVVQILSALR